MSAPTIELELFIHMRDAKRCSGAIRVSRDGVYRETDENPFLPTSQVEIVREPAGLGPALIRMPAWLAQKRGLA